MCRSLIRFCGWKQMLDSVQAVQVRSAYTRFCALELFVSNANFDDIAKAAAETDFKAVLKPGESFVVRINRIRNYADEAVNTMTLEGKLGKQILNQTEGTKVSLKNPDKTFIGIITRRKTHFRLKTNRYNQQNLLRTPSTQKTFFPPVGDAVEDGAVHGESWRMQKLNRCCLTHFVAQAPHSSKPPSSAAAQSALTLKNG